MLKSTRSYERDLSGRMYMTLKVGLNPPALTSGIAVHGLLVPVGLRLNPPALTSGIFKYTMIKAITKGLNPPALTSGICRRPASQP